MQRISRSNPTMKYYSMDRGGCQAPIWGESENIMRNLINKILDTVAPITDRIHVYSAMTASGRKMFANPDAAKNNTISEASIIETDITVKIPRGISAGAEAAAYVCETYGINER